MTTPTPRLLDEDDEDALELPPLGGDLDGAEQDYLPDDDSDLGLAGADSEEVGLDVETGVGEPLEAELGSDVDHEATRWTEGSEADEGLAGADAELIEGEEYGWTGDDEPADGEQWDEDLGLDEAGASLVDGGEEGLLDDGLSEELGELPPLDQDAEEAARNDEEAAEALEAFDLALLDELAEGSLDAEEPLVPIGAGTSWPAIAAARVQMDVLKTLDGEALLAASGGQAVLFHGGRLWSASATEPAEQLGALAGSPTSLWLSGEHLALGVAGAVLTSSDGGRSVERHAVPAGVPRVPVQAGWTRGAREHRLWAAPADGPLLSANGEGEPLAIVEPDARVLALTTDGRHALARVLRAADGSGVVERSTDNGESWEAWRAPVDTVDALVSIAVVREVVVVARSAPTDSVLYVREEGPWCEALPRGCAPIALVDDERDAQLYACVPTPTSTFIVRRSLSDASRTPKIVAELRYETHGRPRALAVGHEEGSIVLWVTTERAWLRITARLDVGTR